MKNRGFCQILMKKVKGDNQHGVILGGALWLGELQEVRFFEKSFAQSCNEGSGKVGKKEGNGRQQGGSGIC